MIGIILLIIAALSIAGVALFFYLRSKAIIESGWSLDSYSTNVSLDKTPAAGSILSFKFPPAYPGVHSISKHVPVGSLKLGEKISITFEITGTNPVFIAAGETPQLRLYIGAGQYYSLGPAGACDLKIGKQTLSIPLTADRWKDITGVPFNQTPAQTTLFNGGIPNSGVVAFIFGDEHGDAHGANLSSGSAEFKLLSFSP